MRRARRSSKTAGMEFEADPEYERQLAEHRRLEEEREAKRKVLTTPRREYNPLGAQSDMDDSHNILSDSWDESSAARRASAHASSVAERANMLASLVTHSTKSPSPQSSVSARLSAFGLLSGGVADAFFLLLFSPRRERLGRVGRYEGTPWLTAKGWELTATGPTPTVNPQL